MQTSIAGEQSNERARATRSTTETETLSPTNQPTHTEKH